MDPDEIRLIRKVVMKERGAEVFLEKSTCPHPLRALESIGAPPCFLIANLVTNLDVGGENSLRTWIKSFFSNPQFTIVNAPYRKHNSSPIGKCAMVFVPPLTIGK
jgi:hypothetical protein